MEKKWSSGKIAGVVIGSIAGVIILFVSFVTSVIWLSAVITVMEDNSAYEQSGSLSSEREKRKERREERREEKEDRQGDEEDKSHEDSDEYRDEYSDESEPFYDTPEDEEYYEFSNAVRDDLSYEVTFEGKKRTEFEGNKNNAEVEVAFTYPVVSGSSVTNLEGINNAIQEEIGKVEEYVGSNTSYLTEGESYYFSGEGYVTYMSEELLSVAFVEYGYMNGEYLESYVVSVNVDMQTGMILDNTELLEIDDSFSVDFRERCEKQNGENEGLSYLSDQDITSCLTDHDYLIAFYTPLGMEIGFNYYDGWVTVTYHDYEKFQKQF